LLYLPDFSMYTPIHFLLENDYYETFNSIVKKLERRLESIINDVKFIETITKMFIFILENVKTLTINSLKRN
jgi:hypothetical protein